MILTFSHAVAQNDIQASTEIVVSNEELVMLFVGFIVAIIGVCIFLARDVILRKKTAYDSEKLESKKTRRLKNIILTGVMTMRISGLEKTMQNTKSF